MLLPCKILSPSLPSPVSGPTPSIKTSSGGGGKQRQAQQCAILSQCASSSAGSGLCQGSVVPVCPMVWAALQGTAPACAGAPAAGPALPAGASGLSVLALLLPSCPGTAQLGHCTGGAQD